MLVQQFRVRLRRTVRVAGQLTTVLDLLGLDFLAQVFRAVVVAALLAMLLLDLLARQALGLAVACVRVLRGPVVRLLRAVCGALLALMLHADTALFAYGLTPELINSMK